MKTKALVLALSMAIAPGLWACGPDFPNELLADRDKTLRGMIDGMFMFEATQLVKDTRGLKLAPDDPNGYGPYLREDAEKIGLSEPQQEVLARVRAATSLQEAKAVAGELPKAVRLYAEGAVAYGAGDREGAQQRFTEILALPEAESASRIVWANYMLASMAVRYGDESEAKKLLERTRALNVAGQSDPLNLAVASLGEEALIHWWRDEVAPAVRLYAEQASYGDSSGATSLLQVARRLLREPELLAASVRDPLVQKLVTSYVFTRPNEALSDDERWELYDSESQGPVQTSAIFLERLVAVLDEANLDRVEGSDRLAAAAYRAGRFDLAARFQQRSSTALATWVKSKLLLRDGKREEALLALREAAQAFPEQESWGSWTYDTDLKPRCQIKGEAATLELARGEFVAAADLMFEAGSDYWTDLAHIAERVLTVDELVAFARRVAPKVTFAGSERGDQADGAAYLNGALRHLTARRLLRSGRLQESLAWFADLDGEEAARQYVAALMASQRGSDFERAEALFAAAQLARAHGMEMLGFERDPDYFLYAGSYDLNSPLTYDSEYNPINNPRTDVIPHGDWVHASEPVRMGTSLASPLQRFHYRYQAFEFATQAADLLPAWSQASAAVLCHGTRYLIDQDPEVARRLYRRYVQDGPYVPWATHFGRVCPEPNFQKAAADLSARTWQQRKHTIKRFMPFAAVSVALVGLGMWWRSRKVRNKG
jgi:hypothetical protein